MRFLLGYNTIFSNNFKYLYVIVDELKNNRYLVYVVDNNGGIINSSSQIIYRPNIKLEVQRTLYYPSKEEIIKHNLFDGDIDTLDNFNDKLCLLKKH